MLGHLNVQKAFIYLPILPTEYRKVQKQSQLLEATTFFFFLKFVLSNSEVHFSKHAARW